MIVKTFNNPVKRSHRLGCTKMKIGMLNIKHKIAIVAPPIAALMGLVPP
jgi:hypothetical protein